MRVMIHELKSPVAATKMIADTYTQFHTEHPKTVTLACKVAERMDRMNDLIQDILELASVKSGQPMSEIAVFNLVEEVRASIAFYQPQARLKGLDMKVTLSQTPLEIRMDLRGLRLILSNLLSNAIKYTLQGTVEVNLHRNDRFAVFQVRDSGIGIPEKDIPKLFQEFFRAGNAKKARITGSGVGLAGVKSIVERFQGTMELQSRENYGSTFTVQLPLYESLS